LNPNVAIVDAALAKKEEGRQSVTMAEKQRPKKKTPGLGMDRNATKSIGGLADQKKGGCCIIS